MANFLAYADMFRNPTMDERRSTQAQNAMAQINTMEGIRGIQKQNAIQELIARGGTPEEMAARVQGTDYDAAMRMRANAQQEAAAEQAMETNRSAQEKNDIEQAFEWAKMATPENWTSIRQKMLDLGDVPDGALPEDYEQAQQILNTIRANGQTISAFEEKRRAVNRHFPNASEQLYQELVYGKRQARGQGPSAKQIALDAAEASGEITPAQRRAIEMGFNAEHIYEQNREIAVIKKEHPLLGLAADAGYVEPLNFYWQRLKEEKDAQSGKSSEDIYAEVMERFVMKEEDIKAMLPNGIPAGTLRMEDGKVKVAGEKRTKDTPATPMAKLVAKPPPALPLAPPVSTAVPADTPVPPPPTTPFSTGLPLEESSNIDWMGGMRAAGNAIAGVPGWLRQNAAEGIQRRTQALTAAFKEKAEQTGELDRTLLMQLLERSDDELVKAGWVPEDIKSLREVAAGPQVQKWAGGVYPGQ